VSRHMIVEMMWCCSVLQCVAVCCSVLQCVAVGCIFALREDMSVEVYDGGNDVVLRCVAVCCSVLQCGAVCCSVLQCVVYSFLGRAQVSRQMIVEMTWCCSVLQCVAVWCSVLQRVAVCRIFALREGMSVEAYDSGNDAVLQCVACVAVCCSVLQWGVYSLFRRARVSRHMIVVVTKSVCVCVYVCVCVTHMSPECRGI